MKKWLAIIITVVILGVGIVVLLLGVNKTTKYTVTFYSNDGTILKIDSVDENSSATPPITPMMTNGMIFKSWDTDFSDVTRDLDVRPVCEEVKGKENVIVVHGSYSKNGSTAIVPIQLCGDVCVSGLDITVRYDHELLELDSIVEDKAVVYNSETPGIININFVSIENTVADVDICNLKFFVKAIEGEIPITVEVNGIYAFKDEVEDVNYDLIIPESSVIDGKVFVFE